MVDEYLIICAELGVKVNLSKSLLSRAGSVEFAKRFMTVRGDCSPVSVGELLVSRVNFSVMSNWPRKRPIRIADLLTLMGYRHKSLSKINKPLMSLPKRIRNMIIVLRSPWGATPTQSLSEWLSINGLKRFTNIPLDYAKYGIVLIEMFYALHKKSQKTVAWNALPNRLMGISGGRKTQDEAVNAVRKADGNTFRAIHSVVYEPVRKETFAKAKVIMREISDVRVNLMRRVFFLDSAELDIFFKKYLDLEFRLYQLRTDTSLQVLKDDFVMPSARSVTKI